MATRNYYTSVVMGSTGPPPEAFVSTWRTTNTSAGSSTSTQVKLPLVFAGTYNFSVNWGDSSSDTITVWNQAQTTHTYASSGDYTITITGTLTGWQFSNTGDRLKILSISQWGTMKIGSPSSSGYFYGCTNLTSTATDVPDTTGVTSFLNGFRDCLNFSQSFATLNVTSAQNMRAVFFNSGFNNALPTSWPALTTTTEMFRSGTFNQVINWSCPSLLTANNMFLLNTAYNSSFTISAPNLTTLAQAFSQCPMNSAINVTSSALTSISSIFNSTTAFNGALNIPTSNLTDVSTAFQNADAFTQSLASWTVPQIQNFTGFMNIATGLSTANYDATLISWAAQGFHPSARSISFGGSKYTSTNPTVVAARNVLIAHFTTFFSDGGPA